LNLNTRNGFYGLTLIGCLAGWMLIAWNQFAATPEQLSVCAIKHMTDIPCPSCGSTRSALAFFHGGIIKALNLNPMGIFVALFLLIAPLWILVDWSRQSDSFFRLWLWASGHLRRPVVYIPLALLMLLNWLWNIQKGM
jgi:hypothetical protein